MNRPQHLAVGSLVGLAVYFVEKKRMGEEPTLLETLAVAGMSAFAGILPDIIEPATSSWHRGFCHSLVGGGALGLSAFGTSTIDDGGDRCVTPVAKALVAAYLSHLALDASSPRGLPLVIQRY